MNASVLCDALAEALCRSEPEGYSNEAGNQWESDCRAVATVLSLQYSGFDVKEFLERCGL